ncbi:MAG: DEAD/DEAH box helicase [Planctomycetota bacterium]|jgi:ATP-dependent RNA helicase RhlE
MSDVKQFTELALIGPLARAVADEGYDTPTPIQARCIPDLLKGRDLLGCAQTGTGKTAAFALPILQGLDRSGSRDRHIRALIMTPTRELAAQIDESFRTYGRHLSLTSTVIFGGVSQHPQQKALRRKPEILVATPGRLLDLMGQKLISLKHLEYFVLDEADRMLDMGFIHDVRRVIEALPTKRQSLFFSATMPPAVAQLADRLLTDPVRVEVAPQSTTPERVDQTLMFVDKYDKGKLLKKLLEDRAVGRALVFSRTKHGADRICKQLLRVDVSAGTIHGNRSQNARTRALEGFRSGKIRVLVATDIAARGIDVDDVTHVINFDMPNEPESYVHRIGRTARAGRDGKAISFCSGDEFEYLQSVEGLLKGKVPVVVDHGFHSEDASNGLVDGQPAESPHKQSSRRQAERARQRRDIGPRITHHPTKRPKAKRAPAGPGRSKQRPKAKAAKAAAPTKNARRRRRRTK